MSCVEQSNRYEVKCLSSMVGRQLPFSSLLIPFGWCGQWRVSRDVRRLARRPDRRPGVCRPQFLVSNLHGPWLVDIVSSISSMTGNRCVAEILQPRENGSSPKR